MAWDRPRVVSVTPDLVEYEDGTQVARGHVPEVDQDASDFEKGPTIVGPSDQRTAIVGPSDAVPSRMGGYGASAPMAFNERDRFVQSMGGPATGRDTMSDFGPEAPMPSSPAAAPQARPSGTLEGLPVDGGRMRDTGIRPAGTVPPSPQAPGVAPTMGPSFAPATPGGAAPRGDVFYARTGGGGGGPLTTTTVRREVPMGPTSPEEAAAAAERARLGGEARDRYEGAVLDRGEIRLDAADEAAVYRTQMAERYANASKDLQHQRILNAERERGRAEAYQRQEQAQREASERARNARVDPERVYGEDGSRSEIADALALALGSIGSSLAGGPNIAAQLVSAAIDRDIAAQRDALSNARADSDEQRGLLAEMRSRFGDDRQAEAVTRAAMIEDTLFQLQEYDPLLATTEERAAAEDLRAQLEAELASQRQAGLSAADQAAQQRWGVMTVEQRQRSGGGAGRPQQMVRLASGIEVPVTAGNALGLDERLTGGGEQSGPMTIPGLEVSDERAAAELTPTDRTALRRVAAGYNTLQDSANRLVALREEYGGEVLPTEGRAQLEAESARAMRALSVLEEAGALGDQEREFYREQIGAVTGVASFSPMVTSRLRALQDRARNEGEARLAPYGYRPAGSTSYTPSTAGAPVE